MIAQLLDNVIAAFAPRYGVQRAHARKVLRHYKGAEPHRLNAQSRPKNQSADMELSGPFGADSMRASARDLVRNNAWAWSALDSIVSETIGTGIGIQSALEDDSGQDMPDTNENRDKTWQWWCEVCDLNGQLTFDEIQTLAYREMVEAGECLVHMVAVPQRYKGIYRPVPLALELIEADRLATDRDSYIYARRNNANRVIRGVEVDETGRPVAYLVYPDHPTAPVVMNREPVRIEAANILHLFRRDRFGQTRGMSWFAPVVQWLRDLGLYVDHEIQASAVASCFTVAIKSDSPIDPLNPPEENSNTTDADGNRYEFIQPGLVMRLRTNESMETANPGRPNSSSEPWINLMLRGIAAGTGTSYEAVTKDFSNTSYSSARTSKLENRPRFRRGQNYWMAHFCQPIWDRFCDYAAFAGREEFPTHAELLDDRRKYAPVEFTPPTWEWVDLTAEQQASEAAINAFQSTYQHELGGKGLHWRRVLRQRAKEEAEKRALGLISPTEATAQAQLTAAEGQAVAAQANAGTDASAEMMGMSRLQWQRNRKAIEDVLNDFASGEISETKARVFLGSIGMKQESIDLLIQDAKDGSVDQLPAEEEVEPVA